MLRAFSTLGCPEFTLEQTLLLATRHAIPAIEIRALGGTVELADYFSREFGTPPRRAQKLHAAGVRLVSLDASLHLIGATAAERDQLAAFAPWADGLGVKWLRVFDGGKQADATELG